MGTYSQQAECGEWTEHHKDDVSRAEGYTDLAGFLVKAGQGPGLVEKADQRSLTKV